MTTSFTPGGAVRLLAGESVASTYIGSLRYGVDMPMAFFIWLLGRSEVGAAFWGLMTSLMEVGVVFACARTLWGLRTGIVAGILIALLPLHVIFAGRIFGDAPLAFFITLSFYCFLVGNRRDSSPWFFAMGLAVGAVFWVKQGPILYVVSFVVFAALMRHWNWKWFWGVGSALFMLVANCLLMWKLQGDPFHVFRVSGADVSVYGARSDINDDVWLYFRYLFLDVRHTWLLGFLTLLGLWHGIRGAKEDHGIGVCYPAVWGALLIAIFSFSVISLEPLRFIMKQANYMLIFVAPLSLVAGYGVSRLSRANFCVVLGIYVLGSLALSALAQQDVRVFRANSIAAVAYARDNPQTQVYATTNAYNRAVFENDLSASRAATPVLRHLNDLRVLDPGVAVGAQALPRRAIIDTQNLSWGGNPFSTVEEVPDCWNRIGELESPTIGGGGRSIVRVLIVVASFVPGGIGELLASRLRAFAVAKPAYVYDVPADCGLPPGK